MLSGAHPFRILDYLITFSKNFIIHKTCILLKIKNNMGNSVSCSLIILLKIASKKRCVP